MKKYLKKIGIGVVMIFIIIFFLPNKLSQTRSLDECFGFKIQLVCFGIADDMNDSTIKRKIDFWKTPNKFCGTEGMAVPTIVNKCCDGFYEDWGNGGVPGGLGICRKDKNYDPSLKTQSANFIMFEKINILTKGIDNSGDEIEIKNSGTPVDGIKIIIPPGAIEKETEIQVGYYKGNLKLNSGTPAMEGALVVDIKSKKELLRPIEIIKKTNNPVAVYQVETKTEIGQLEPMIITNMNPVTTLSFLPKNIIVWVNLN
jgi:hypothetical protein